MSLSLSVCPNTTPASYANQGLSQFSGATHMTANSARRRLGLSWFSNHDTLPLLMSSDIHGSTPGMTSLSHVVSFLATRELLQPDQPMNTSRGIAILLSCEEP